MASNDAESIDDGTKKTVGAFDIRYIISALLGVYGVVTLLLGLFNNSAEELARGDGLNINLYAGIMLIAVSAFFGVWAKLRPTIVPDDFEDDADAADGAPPSDGSVPAH